MEWYDVAIYAYFAVYVSRAYFPAHSETVSLLLTFATFALSFAIRPVGALVLGAYADRIGRKPALTLTIWLMTIGTAFIAFTPSYATLGIAAPLLVLLGRLLQGFSAGGEFGSATALMLEHLPRRKGFASSWQAASQMVSMLLAAIVGAVLTSTMSEDALNDWGFRIPFILGLLVAPAGLYIRKHVPETPEFEAVKEIRVQDVSRPRLIVSHLPRMLALMVVVGLASALVYSTTYIPTYAVRTLHLPPNMGFVSVIVVGVLSLLLYPVVGWISDRYRHSSQMLLGVVLIAAVLYPAYAVITTWPSVATLIGGLAVLVVAKTIFGAPLGAQLGDSFPTEIRGFGMSVSYSLGVALFGGVTPFLTTLLLDVTKDPMVPAFLLLGMSLLGFVALLVLRAGRWDGYQDPKQSGARSLDSAIQPS